MQRRSEQQQDCNRLLLIMRLQQATDCRKYFAPTCPRRYVMTARLQCRCCSLSRAAFSTPAPIPARRSSLPAWRTPACNQTPCMWVKSNSLVLAYKKSARNK